MLSERPASAPGAVSCDCSANLGLAAAKAEPSLKTVTSFHGSMMGTKPKSLPSAETMPWMTARGPQSFCLWDDSRAASVRIGNSARNEPAVSRRAASTPAIEASHLCALSKADACTARMSATSRTPELATIKQRTRLMSSSVMRPGTAFRGSPAAHTPSTSARLARASLSSRTPGIIHPNEQHIAMPPRARRVDRAEPLNRRFGRANSSLTCCNMPRVHRGSQAESA